MTSTARNPYTAPTNSRGDSGPKLGFGLRALRVIAFLGNAFLVALPVLAFLSVGRASSGLLMLAAYCLIVAVGSVMGLAFRDRFSFWAGTGVNVLGLLLSAVLLVHLGRQGDPDWWLLFLIAAPTLPSLLTILLVRRARGPSDDTVAARR